MKLSISFFLTLLSLNSFADIVKPLPANDSLGQTVRAIGTQLGDSNISGGTTSLWVGQLKTTSNFETLVRKGFVEAYKSDVGEAVPADAKLEVKVNQFVDGEARKGDVYKMTAALMESNDYTTNNKELWDSQARYLWVVLRKFPVSGNTLVGHVKTKIKDTSSGEVRSIQYFLLLNNDKKAVQFFTIEGSM